MPDSNGQNGNGQEHEPEYDGTSLDFTALDFNDKRAYAKQRAFLTAFSETGSVVRAAIAAKVSRRAHVYWMSEPGYKQVFDDARLIAAEVLEDEARRRAVQGLRKMKFYKGEPVIDPETNKPYFEHEYSDTLMAMLLNANLPEKFKYRSETTVKADLTIHQPNAPSDAFLRRCNTISPNPETGSN